MPKTYKQRQPRIEAHKFDGSPEAGKAIITWLKRVPEIRGTVVYLPEILDFPEGATQKVLQEPMIVVELRQGASGTLVTRIYKDQYCVLDGYDVYGIEPEDFKRRFEKE